MAFKNALWAAGFPESEDVIVGGSIGTAPWIEVELLPDRPSPQPLMVELAADRDLRVSRGPTAPATANTDPHILLPQDSTVRFELKHGDSVWLRRIGSNATNYSLRGWVRE